MYFVICFDLVMKKIKLIKCFCLYSLHFLHKYLIHCRWLLFYFNIQLVLCSIQTNDYRKLIEYEYCFFSDFFFTNAFFIREFFAKGQNDCRFPFNILKICMCYFFVILYSLHSIAKENKYFHNSIVIV